MLMDLIADEPYVIADREEKKKKMPTKDERNNFSLEIENLVVRHRVSYIEAITTYCEDTGLEVELASKLISSALKGKIADEAQQNNMMKKTSRIPM